MKIVFEISDIGCLLMFQRLQTPSIDHTALDDILSNLPTSLPPCLKNAVNWSLSANATALSALQGSKVRGSCIIEFLCKCKILTSQTSILTKQEKLWMVTVEITGSCYFLFYQGSLAAATTL